MPTQPPLIPAAMLPLASILVSVSPDILVSVQDSALVVADTMQWAWVALPGLPAGTAPSLAGISATGLSPTSSLLVAAYGSSLFTITASQCGLGSYWNGLRCVPHTCVRVPQCDPTQRLVNNQCVCIPGYYSLQGSLCTPCPTGSYCSGGLKYTCPTGGGLTALSAQSTSLTTASAAQWATIMQGPPSPAAPVLPTPGARTAICSSSALGVLAPPPQQAASFR